MARFAVLFCCVVVSSIQMGCRSSPVDTHGLTDAAAMKARLQEALPAGTSLEAARHFMESEGFKCSITWNGSFSENGVRRENIDYVYCDRTERPDTYVERRWQIALVLKDDKTEEVLVSVGLTGP